MKYKIDDWIIYIDKEESDNWENHYGISLYGKTAKIIKIDKDDRTYLLEFKKFVNGLSLKKIGKQGHCIWCFNKEFKSAIDHLKFKKWIKG